MRRMIERFWDSYVAGRCWQRGLANFSNIQHSPNPRSAGQLACRAWPVSGAPPGACVLASGELCSGPGLAARGRASAAAAATAGLGSAAAAVPAATASCAAVRLGLLTAAESAAGGAAPSSCDAGSGDPGGKVTFRTHSSH